MNLNIENPMSGIADKARGRYDETVENVRKRTDKAAGRVTKGKKPVRTISKFGVKVSGISHRTVNKLWRKQTKIVENQIDAVSDHLKAAAKAENLKDFVNTQIDMIPDHTSRFADEARDAIEIVKGAGSEIRGAVKDTVEELRTLRRSARKATPVRKSGATAKEPEPAGKTATAGKTEPVEETPAEAEPETPVDEHAA